MFGSIVVKFTSVTDGTTPLQLKVLWVKVPNDPKLPVLTSVSPVLIKSLVEK